MDVELEEVVKFICDFRDGACEGNLGEEGELERGVGFIADEWWWGKCDILERPMGVGNVFASVAAGGGKSVMGLGRANISGAEGRGNIRSPVQTGHIDEVAWLVEILRVGSRWGGGQGARRQEELEQ